MDKKETNKKLYRFRGSIITKVWAFVAFLLLSAILVGCISGAVEFLGKGYYTSSQNEVVEKSFDEYLVNDSLLILDYLREGNLSRATAYCTKKNIAYASAMWKYSASSDVEYKTLWRYSNNSEGSYDFNIVAAAGNKTYNIELSIDTNFTRADNYRDAFDKTTFLYQLRYWVIAAGIVSGIAIVFLFVFLMCAASHRVGTEEIVSSFDTKIPFDIITVIFMAISVMGLYIASSFSGTVGFLLMLIYFIGVEALVLMWCISLAGHIKAKTLWKGLLVYKFFCGLGRLLLSLSKNLPFIWQVIVATVVITAANFGLVYAMGSARKWNVLMNRNLAFILWLLLQLVTISFVIYIAIMLKKIRHKIESMAKGDIDEEIDRAAMLPVFSKEVDELETIADAMNNAVETKMSSEKMQAVLITNVSHDIKTPLTSVINYADLIGKEHTENEKITEYAEVLGRQANRLKRLLEDLVEASRASTGNLDVNLEPCQVGLLVTQAAAEYEDRLEASGLTLILKNGECETEIMADPRRMWRVFDNLLNNICKYAKSDTRVYLSVECDDKNCYIIFKNTSLQELDMDPNELMQRFVRGDKARNTEGNGLGMAIASNMARLQGGDMKTTIDGDLFKVTLSFPIKL